MTFTRAKIKTDLNNLLQGESESVQDLDSLINMAVSEEYLMTDILESIKRTVLVNVLYDKVNYYTLPSDVKGEAIIDFQKISRRGMSGNVRYDKANRQDYNNKFKSNSWTIGYHAGKRWLEVNFETNTNAGTVHTMDSVLGNGTWVVTDDTTAVSSNKINYLAGSGSLGATLGAGGTTLGIENSTMNPIDISANEDVGSFFTWVYLPEVVNVSNISLYIGSDSSNYWQMTASTPFNLGEFQLGWNLVQFEWSGAVETGSPSSSVVDYVKLSIGFSSTPTELSGYLFDNIIIDSGEAFDIEYYSTYPWETSSGTEIEESTTDTDALRASSESYRSILYKVAVKAARSIPMSAELINSLENDYMTYNKQYKHKFPSKRKKLKNSYYR